MTVTREQMIKMLADKTGYFQRDIRNLLYGLDDIVEELCGEVTEGDDVLIQIVRGIKISAHVVPQRDRVNPQNLNPVTVKPTVKPKAIFSDNFRDIIQKKFEDKTK